MERACPTTLIPSDGEEGGPYSGPVPSSTVQIFQPQKKKHPTYDPKAPPLSQDVMKFLCCIRSHIGSCAVSGSAALSQVLYERNSPKESTVIQKLRKLTKNNDIDFFVPLYPNLQSYREGKKIPTGVMYAKFYPLLREYVLPQFPHFRCEGSSLDKLPEQSKKALEYNFLSLSPGLHEIIDMHTPGNGPNIQIIVLHTIVYPHQGTWDDVITENFDINIVKLKVGCKSLHDLRPQLAFVDPTAAACLEEGTFDYVVRPAQNYKLCESRIRKYLNRGFLLRSLRFDPRLPELGKNEWCNLARKSLCTKMLQKMMESSPLAPKEDRMETKKRRSEEEDEEDRQNETKKLQPYPRGDWEDIKGQLELVSQLVQEYLPVTDFKTSCAIKKLQVKQERERISDSTAHWPTEK